MVLAADSRVTLQMPVPIPGAAPGGPSIMLVPATFDNATKLLKVIGQEHVAAVTYGAGTVGYPEARTAHSLLPEFEATLGVTFAGDAGLQDITECRQMRDAVMCHLRRDCRPAPP